MIHCIHNGWLKNQATLGTPPNVTLIRAALRDYFKKIILRITLNYAGLKRTCWFKNLEQPIRVLKTSLKERLSWRKFFFKASGPGLIASRAKVMGSNAGVGSFLFKLCRYRVSSRAEIFKRKNNRSKRNRKVSKNYFPRQNHFLVKNAFFNLADLGLRLCESTVNEM